MVHEWTPADETAFVAAVQQEDATAALGVCEREVPRHARTWFRMAAIYRAKRRWEDLQALLSSAAASVIDASMWVWLAEAHVHGGDPSSLADGTRRASALDALDHAMTLPECPAEAFDLRWRWHRTDESSEQARAFLERGLAATNDAFLRRNLANELRKAQAYAAAIDTLSPLLATELPANADEETRDEWQWTFWLAFAAYRALGDWTSALALLLRFEAPDDNRRAVQLVMAGQMLQVLGDDAGASTAYEAAGACTADVDTSAVAGLLHLWSSYRRDGATPSIASALDALLAREDIAAAWTSLYGQALWVAQMPLPISGWLEACETWATDDTLSIAEATRARLLFYWLADRVEHPGWEEAIDASDLQRRIDRAAQVTRHGEYLDLWCKASLALGTYAVGVTYGLASDRLKVSQWTAEHPDTNPPLSLTEAGWLLWPTPPLKAVEQAAVLNAALVWWMQVEPPQLRPIVVRSFYTHVWRGLLIEGEEYVTLLAVATAMIDAGGRPEELKQWYFDCGLACQHSHRSGEAVTHYRAAMNMGVHPAAAYNLSIIAEERGELDHALGWAKQALAWSSAWKIVPPRIARLEALISKRDTPPLSRPKVYPRFRPTQTGQAEAQPPAALDAVLPREAPSPLALAAVPIDTTVVFRQRTRKETTGRQALSKKVRYEVFKRDGFKCTYCGRAAPDAVLHVDHIHPVAEGGSNDMLNLTTACEDCNQGKGARRLDDSSAVAKSRAQMEEMHARQEQIGMLLAWHKGLQNVAGDALDQVASYWNDLTPGWFLNERGLKDLKKLLRKFSLSEVLQAMDLAADQYLEQGADGRLTPASVSNAQEKIGRICSVARDTKNDPDLPDLLYIRKILVSELVYCDSRRAMEDLRAARSWGVPMAELKSLARSVSSWTGFRHEIDRVIERAQRASAFDAGKTD